MEQNKINKIAVVSLIFCLIALSETQGISNISTFTINLIAGNGINISQTGDNYTISATGNISGNGSTDISGKLNKTGDKFESSNSIFSSYYNRIDMKIIDSLTPINTHKIDILFSGGNLTRISPAGIYSPFFESVSGYKDDSKTGSTNRFAVFNTTGHIISGINVNQSDNSKVNKSGDNMTGYLNIQGMRIGDFQNYTTQGFDMNSTKYQGAFSVYDDGGYMYGGQSLNAYYDGKATYPSPDGWHKKNQSLSSIITVLRVGLAPSLQPYENDPIAIDTYYVPPDQNDPFWSHILLSELTNRTMYYYVNLSSSKLAGSGNDYVCVDPNGKLFRQNAVC